jgi:hypothetical protein
MILAGVYLFGPNIGPEVDSLVHRGQDFAEAGNILSIVSHHSGEASSRLGGVEAGKTGDGLDFLQGWLDAGRAHRETQEVHLSQEEIHFSSRELDSCPLEPAKDRHQVLQVLGLTVREYRDVVAVDYNTFQSC